MCDGERVCVGEGLHGLAGMACLVVLLKQKHSRGFKNYQMVVLSLSESALLQPYASELQQVSGVLGASERLL